MASGLYDMKQVSATNTRQSGDSCYSELADVLLTDDLFFCYSWNRKLELINKSALYLSIIFIFSFCFICVNVVLKMNIM